MKAVVFRDIGKISLEEVKDPKIQDPTDAVIRLTSSAICGTDLHMIRGTMPGMVPGTVLGHEGVGVVEDIGKGVRNLRKGDRVVVPSSIGCGYCSYCRVGYYAQCDHANPNGMTAGTAFFGGPKTSGPFHGLQAEYARIPFANVGLVKLPHEISDDQAISLSDIFPTAYFGAILAEIKPGDTVAVFGCGPVGQFVIASAKHLRAGRIFAIDCIPSRLLLAQEQGAEVINFNQEDPVEMLLQLTGGIGVDRAVDAAGIDANHPHHGPAAKQALKLKKEFVREVSYIAPTTHPEGDNWHPGDGPSQALRWAVEGLAKAGSLSIIGVYPENAMVFPIGKAMNKNLTVKMGNCNHRKYIPLLIDLIQSKAVDPTPMVTQKVPFAATVEAYKYFDRREPGWVKVKLDVPGLAEEGEEAA